MPVCSSGCQKWGGHSMEKRRGKSDVAAQREAERRDEESKAGQLRAMGKTLWFQVRLLVLSSRICCGHIDSPTSRLQFRSQVL